MITTIHWLRPYCWLLILPLILLIIMLYQRKKVSPIWQTICDPHLLPYLLITRPTHYHSFPLFLLGIAWLLTVLALAGPSASQNKIPIYQQTNARIIAFNLSTSMYTKDILPNRLTRAKFKIQDILKRLHEGQIGMIAFTEEAYVVSPLTQDAATISNLLSELAPQIMPIDGHNISAALLKAADLFQQGGVNQGNIILITDGEATNRDIQIAQNLAKRGIKTSILGIGTESGAPTPTDKGFLKDKNGNVMLSKLNSVSLFQLTHNGQGYYQAITDDEHDIQQLLEKTEKHTKAVRSKTQQSIWQDQGRYVVLLILPFAILAFRRGWFEHIVY